MYDTIGLVALQDEFRTVDFLNELPQYLQSIINSGESFQGQFVNGYIENFKISINRHRVKLHGASLARFINGENQTGMTLQQTKIAIKALSDQLHLDLNEAKVVRIDVGRNIVTKFRPAMYLPYLGESIGYKRQEAGDGLYFKNSVRTLTFYDKWKEQKSKRQDIISIFEGRNILRYELRFENHLEREFKRNKITAKTLIDEDFYIQVGKEWRDQYKKIKKRPNESSIIPATSSTRELMIYLSAITIQHLGDESLLNMISEWQQAGFIQKKQASDHRKMIRDTMKRDFKMKGNQYIEELDKKIKEATRFFI